MIIRWCTPETLPIGSVLQPLARFILLFQILKSHPIYIITNDQDTETDWYTSEFISECLCWHNVYRERHGSPPLAMCPDVSTLRTSFAGIRIAFPMSNSPLQLCSYAQDWANVLAHMNIFYYRPDAGDVGQNIYCRLNVKDPAEVSGKEVASYWYRACRRYDYLKEPNVLHATVDAGERPTVAIIWFSTRNGRRHQVKDLTIARYSRTLYPVNMVRQLRYRNRNSEEQIRKGDGRRQLPTPRQHSRSFPGERAAASAGRLR